MGKQRNVGREIALSLGAAVVFGAGFYTYLMKSMPSHEELAPKLVSSSAASAHGPVAPDDLVLGNAVFEPFGDDLAAKRFDAAYARMAEPYRAAFTLEAFRASCERSPFLSRVQRAGLLKTTRMSLGAAPGDAPDAPYTVRGQGVLASGAGSIDAAVTLLIEHGDARILVLSLGGIPVLDGVSGPAQ